MRQHLASEMCVEDNLEVGDVIVYFHKPYFIRALEEHVHPELGPYLVARSDDGWGIAVWPRGGGYQIPGQRRLWE